jgi:hypothetical protein
MFPETTGILSNRFEVTKRPACAKIQYRSFREAQEVINNTKKHRFLQGKRMNRKIGKKDKRPIRSYKCHICGFWHLTSQQEIDD